MKVKCICSAMGRPGTKCRKCSRTIPEVIIINEEKSCNCGDECMNCTEEDCTCDENAEDL